MSFQDANNNFQVFTDAQGNILWAIGRDGLLKNVGGAPLIGQGSPILVAKFDALAQQANITSTPIFTVPANMGGMYRAFAYAVTTQAATTSSTLPAIGATYTDLDSGVVAGASMTNSVATNTVGVNSTTWPAIGQANIWNVKAGTVISISTTGYASVGATPMQYAIHIKLEYLGQ